MHITIEGIDGVGKSTAAKAAADALGFEFVEKPLHYIFDNGKSFENYIRIRDFFNAQPNRVLSAWFYGLGNIYTYEEFKGKNIITDRHILSNYCWSGTYESEDVFDLIIKKIGLPDFTFILYADVETVKNRIQGRDITDKDIEKAEKIPELYEKMEGFCKKHKMPYLVINTINKDKAAVAEEIISKVKVLLND
jgi:thymidylate kinase